MQSKRIQAWPSLNNDTSHLLPQRARVRACVLAFERGRRARVFTNVLCMYVSCACRRRVLTSVRARRRLVCVRDRHVCAFTNVRCIDVSCACRVRVVTSVRARRRLVCVCAVCVLSRVCVRVDVSCACVTVMCVLSRACVALTSRVRDSYLSQEHERFGPLVHFRPLYR